MEASESKLSKSFSILKRLLNRIYRFVVFSAALFAAVIVILSQLTHASYPVELLSNLQFQFSVMLLLFTKLAADGKLLNSEHGFGYQPTWTAQFWPLRTNYDCILFRIPVDHVLVSKDIAVLDRKMLEPISSDHLPLLVTIGIKKK